jgi:hypothetical protein
MADAAFREAQRQHLYDEHVRPINQVVDTLREMGRGWLPYVAPMYGGTSARLLSLLRDPGPKTQAEGGSGLLSMENDDATAEAISSYFADAGIDAKDIVPWNVYPWYINRAPSAAELNAEIEPLRALVELMPNLRVVMLHGGTAQNGWRRFCRAHPRVAQERRFEVLPTYHTSRQAFWHRDRNVRDSRRADLCAAFAKAARLLSSGAGMPNVLIAKDRSSPP